MIPKPQLVIPMWLDLPIEVRAQLVSTFGIPRTGGTHVQDGVVMTDGYTHADLATITVEKMQTYLNSQETDFFKLFEQVLMEIPVLHEEPKPLIPTPEPSRLVIEHEGKKYVVVEEIPGAIVPRLQPKPVAPYGLKKDGTPKKAPGRKK